MSGQATAAVLLRRRSDDASSNATRYGKVTLELAAVWVDPTLEDRLEVACCLLYFMGQYLAACDNVDSLHEGVTETLYHLNTPCQRWMWPAAVLYFLGQCLAARDDVDSLHEGK